MQVRLCKCWVGTLPRAVTFPTLKLEVGELGKCKEKLFLHCVHGFSEGFPLFFLWNLDLYCDLWS